MQYLKKEASDELDFLYAVKNENFQKKWYYYFWWGSSSIPKAPKIESLQCIYNISKKIKHQSLLQGDTIIINGHDQAFSK